MATEETKSHPAVRGFAKGVKVSYKVVKGGVKGVLTVRKRLGAKTKVDPGEVGKS